MKFRAVLRREGVEVEAECEALDDIDAFKAAFEELSEWAADMKGYAVKKEPARSKNEEKRKQIAAAMARRKKEKGE